MSEPAKIPENITELARISKVMGHPVRLYILHKLSKMGACCYSGNLVEELPIGRSTLSQHLKELKYAGLIQGQIEPPYIKYCINSQNWEKVRELYSDFFALEEAKKGFIRILILCTGNSCRSQMAEGFLRSMSPNLEVHSAGTEPSEAVHPLAIKVMQEEKIDLSGHAPKSVDEFLDTEFDYVVTVCDGANESCPAFTGKVGQRLHLGFEDPAKVEGSEEFVLSEFRRIRDEIKRDFTQFFENKLKPRL